MKKPDRYTTFTLDKRDLPTKIEQAESLGLKWFARSDYGNSNDVWLYLFFDEEGMQAFLSKEWGNKLDTVTEWARQLKDRKITHNEFLEKSIEFFENFLDFED